MDLLLSFPFGTFLLLLGLLWEPQLKTKKDLKAEKALIAAGETDDFDDWDATSFESLTSKQQRNYLRRVGQRVLMVVIGVGISIFAFIDTAGSIGDTDAFLLLFGLYGGFLLLTQRAEKAGRRVVFFTMSFIGFLVWRTALFYDYDSENAWALLAAVSANLLFWLTIGQLYPPGSSDTIEVIGMEG
jgi:hypothetical protein